MDLQRVQGSTDYFQVQAAHYIGGENMTMAYPEKSDPVASSPVKQRQEKFKTPSQGPSKPSYNEPKAKKKALDFDDSD